MGWKMVQKKPVEQHVVVRAGWPWDNTKGIT